MKYFIAQEFLPKRVYDYFQDKYNNGALGLRYINPNIIPLMTAIREYIGNPIIINNWFQGGPFNDRVLRLKDDPSYREYSDHTRGNACDFHVPGVDNKAIYDILLLEIPNTLKGNGVTSVEALESTPTWVHLGVSDVSNWKIKDEVNGIKIIKP